MKPGNTYLHHQPLSDALPCEYSKYLSPFLSPQARQALRQRLTSANVQLIDEQLSTVNPQCRRPALALALQRISVRPIKVEARGALITYKVEIGVMVLSIQLLNISKKAPLENRQKIYHNESEATWVAIGRADGGREFICKRFYFCDERHVLRRREEG